MKNKFCTNCGSSLEENAKFCTKCGAKVQTIVADSLSKSESGEKTLSKIDLVSVKSESLHLGVDAKNDLKNLAKDPKATFQKLDLFDYGAILGGILTLLGVYFFKFVNISVSDFNFSGSLSSLVKQIDTLINGALGTLAQSFGAGSEISKAKTVVTELKFVIAILTISSLMAIVAVFVKNKIAKLISIVLAAISFITFFVMNSGITEAFKAMDVSSSEVVNGAGGKVIVVGLLLMLITIAVKTYQGFVKKS